MDFGKDIFINLYFIGIVLTPMLMYLTGCLMLPKDDKLWFNSINFENTIFSFSMLNILTIFSLVSLGLFLMFDKFNYEYYHRMTRLEIFLAFLVPLSIIIYCISLNLSCVTRSLVTGGFLYIIAGIAFILMALKYNSNWKILSLSVFSTITAFLYGFVFLITGY